jgi:hypothetical protein
VYGVLGPDGGVAAAVVWQPHGGVFGRLGPAPSEPAFVQVLPVAESRTPTTLTELPHRLIGALTGTWTVLPEPTPGEPCELPPAVAPPEPEPEPEGAPLTQVLSSALSPIPTPLIELPHRLIGALTGTWIRLPEPTPGELCAPPAAVAPFEPAFVQVLPVAESRTPMTEMLLPHRLIGALTGTWTRLPDSSPGEPAAVPTAVASAYAMPIPSPPTSRPPVVIPRTTRRFVERCMKTPVLIVRAVAQLS